MDNVKDDVKPTPQIEEQPTPNILGEAPDKVSDKLADQAVDLSAILSHPDFEALLDKKVQSVKDVRFGKLGTEVKDLRATLTEYDSLVASGVPQEEAKLRMEGSGELQSMRDRLAVLEGKDIGGESAGAGEPSWAEKQATILSNAGLEPNDSRLAELLRKETFANYDEYLEKLEEVSFEWKQSDAKKPQPSSSTVASTVPSVVAQPGELDEYSDDQLADKLVELLRNPSINQGEIDILDAELTRRDAKK